MAYLNIKILVFDSNLLEKNFKNKKHLKFTLPNIPEVSWDEIINCLDLNVQNNLYIKILKNFGIVIHNTEMIKQIYPVLEWFHAFNPDRPASAHAYISFSSQSETFGWHSDTSDVLFWQCIGSTMFSLLEAGKTISYKLEKNDLLYIPCGVKHSTSPLGPRVGISLGIDYAV